QRIARAFARLRELVLAAYFCTPEGMEDIGYLGNVAIAGDYPGPTPDAYRHLEMVLSELGLSEFAYPVDYPSSRAPVRRSALPPAPVRGISALGCHDYRG